MLRSTLPAGRVPSPPTRITRLRPGERIRERLSAGEILTTTDHPAIVRLGEPAREADEILALTDDLAAACARRDTPSAIATLRRLVPEYQPYD
jgi:FlaA1/EpsC-like NDP-sugar epimerase